MIFRVFLDFKIFQYYPKLIILNPPLPLHGAKGKVDLFNLYCLYRCVVKLNYINEGLMEQIEYMDVI